MREITRYERFQLPHSAGKCSSHIWGFFLNRKKSTYEPPIKKHNLLTGGIIHISRFYDKIHYGLINMLDCVLVTLKKMFCL